MKLRRARMHVDSLKTQSETFFSRPPHPYVVTCEAKPEAGEYEYRVSVRQPFPEMISLIAGDAIHNFRSALDHLAWRLSMDFTPGMNVEERSVQFPIFDTQVGFESRGLSRCRFMGPKAKSIISAVQPYHAPEPALSFLSILSKLDNIDKHKLLTVCGAAFETGEYIGRGLPIAGQSTVDVTWNVAPIEDGMVILRIGLQVPQKDFDPHLKVSYQVVFSEQPSAYSCLPVVYNLEGIDKAVKFIIDLFEPAYISGVYDDGALTAGENL
ncbi:MAG TPA: hypothetical protein PKI89_03805, partial [Tepidiformaceae bacterium]|nr:hypothetical protein [Tepidiformaceae bacterium]